MELQQRVADCLRHELAHGAFAMKFHFAFGGMNIHIDARRINFQKQTANRIAAFHQRRVIAFEQREIESAIFDRATVHEQMLIFARGTGNAGRADKTPEMKVTKSEFRSDEFSESISGFSL